MGKKNKSTVVVYAERKGVVWGVGRGSCMAWAVWGVGCLGRRVFANFSSWDVIKMHRFSSLSSNPKFSVVLTLASCKNRTQNLVLT